MSQPTIPLSRARALVDMLCVQVHTSYSTAPGNQSLIQTALNYLNPLGPHTGVDTLRDDTSANLAVLESFGTKLDIYAAYNSPGTVNDGFLATMQTLVNTGKVVLLEGPLEVDNSGWGLVNNCTYVAKSGKSYTGWSAAIQMQTDLWNTFNGKTFIATFSLANPSNGAAGGPAAGALSYADHSNTHFYPHSGNCPYIELDSTLAAETGYCPKLPKTITETGFNDNTSDFSEGYGTDLVNAKYTLNEICECFIRGIVLMSNYELFDDPGNGTGAEATWGWFTSTGVPKATATAVKNLLTILGDMGATAETFTLQPYTVSVAGLPASGYWFQIQTSDGHNAIVAGVDATIYANGKASVAPSYLVVVTLPAAANSNVYDPTVSTTPAASNTASTVSLTLSDHPLIVVVAPGAVVVPPVTPPVVVTPSVEGTSVNTATGSLVDSAGNTWTLIDFNTSGGPRIAVNGVLDAASWSIKQLVYFNGQVWQETTGGVWWYKTLPTDTWTPSSGLASEAVLAQVFADLRARS